jgi:hypothetical protein
MRHGTRSKKEVVKQWLTQSPAEGRCLKSSPSVNEALSVLKQALSLKANAGGRIKTEIKQAIALLQDLS